MQIVDIKANVTIRMSVPDNTTLVDLGKLVKEWSDEAAITINDEVCRTVADVRFVRIEDFKVE